jgi:hypothetical protein
MFVFALIALVAVANAMTIHDLPVTEEEHTMAFDAMVAAHGRKYAKDSEEYNARFGHVQGEREEHQRSGTLWRAWQPICVEFFDETQKKMIFFFFFFFFFFFCNTAWCSEEGQVRAELVL